MTKRRIAVELEGEFVDGITTRDEEDYVAALQRLVEAGANMGEYTFDWDHCGSSIEDVDEEKCDEAADEVERKSKIIRDLGVQLDTAKRALEYIRDRRCSLYEPTGTVSDTTAAIRYHCLERAVPHPCPVCKSHNALMLMQGKPPEQGEGR